MSTEICLKHNRYFDTDFVEECCECEEEPREIDEDNLFIIHQANVDGKEK